ncbi:MAG: aminopeptidase [Elusimicrobia bacterium]|nr:aminopeptidase [Elusimicrobiota bacterium]
MRRLHAAAGALAGALLLSGCSPVYVVKAASGHLAFVSRAEPIARLIDDPRTDPETRGKLRLVAEVRAFAFQEMGLKASGDYAKVSKVRGSHVSYIVMASRRTSLRLREWWFPFVGRFPYKGYFSPRDAAAERARLEREGYDAHVAGVGAYNTPLWFSDPLPSTELARPAGELAELVLHELVHGTVFFKGQVDFDESLASFVGEAAAEDFLARRFGPGSGELEAYRRGLEKSRLYARELEKVYAGLDALYRGVLSDAEKLERRRPILERGRAALSAVLAADAGPLDNAVILARRLYRSDPADFRAAHEGLGRDWKATMGFFGSLDRRRPWEDLGRRVQALKAAGT